jgi:hypothetical protein
MLKLITELMFTRHDCTKDEAERAALVQINIEGNVQFQGARYAIFSLFMGSRR